MKTTKFLSSIFLIVALSLSGYAQKGTYSIVQKSDVKNIKEYEKAMDDANFDSYRFIDKRRKLVFESGVVIELLSVNELKEKNIAVDESKAILNLPKDYKEPIFKLTDNGHIVAQYPAMLKPNKQLNK